MTPDAITQRVEKILDHETAMSTAGIRRISALIVRDLREAGALFQWVVYADQHPENTDQNRDSLFLIARESGNGGIEHEVVKYGYFPPCVVAWSRIPPYLDPATLAKERQREQDQQANQRAWREFLDHPSTGRQTAHDDFDYIWNAALKYARDAQSLSAKGEK